MGIKILSFEKVSPLAVGFPGIHGAGSDAPEDILAAGHRFQVCWVDAQFVPTQMIDMQANGNRSNERFICPSVSPHLAFIGNRPTERPVSVGKFCPSPNPTRVGFVNLGPKPIFGTPSVSRHGVNNTMALGCL